MNPACNIPWTWLEIDVLNNKIRNCCKTGWINDNANLLFEHPVLIKRREQFLNSERSRDCTHCWKLEDQNQTSYRQYTKSNPFLQTTNFNLPSNIPVTLSVNFGNLCNLACSYCNEEYSSKWAIEKSIPVKIEKNLDFETAVFQYINQLIINDRFRHLILIGGEPTIDPKFYQLLELIESCAATRNLPLRITVQTNGMYNESQRHLLVKASHFKNIVITYRYSMESIGQYAEFIRTGLDWIKFEDNFLHMVNSSKNNNKLNVTVHPTINLYCLESFDKFLSWVDNFDCKSWEDFGMNHLEAPSDLALSTLGIYSKDLWNNRVYKNKNVENYGNNIRRFVESFVQLPTAQDLKSIQQGYYENSRRSGIDIHSAIPRLDELITRLLNK
jgi:hypothetical protein